MVNHIHTYIERERVHITHILHVYIYIYIHIYIYTYVCRYLHVYINMYIHPELDALCVCVCVYIYTWKTRPQANLPFGDLTSRSAPDQSFPPNIKRPIPQ